MKTIKMRLFKKYLKRRTTQARFYSSLGSMRFRENEIIENYNSVGATAHKVEK